MKTFKKMIFVGSLGLSIIGLGVSTNALARGGLQEGSGVPHPRANTFVVESLGSGLAADLYRVSCTARCVRADVNDAGPFDDTIFKVLVSGSSSGFVGNSSRTNPAGGLSSSAEVCASSFVNAPRTAFISFTEVNQPGSENYDTIINCRTAAGGLINPSIVKVLDQ